MMTQEDVRQLLLELGGEGSTTELAKRAKKEFPNRTYHTYIGQLLHQLEQKDFVRKENGDWILTDRGRNTSIEGIPITDIDIGAGEAGPLDKGFDIVNIVSTIDIDRELDLAYLSNNLSNSEYHPESSPFLVYRPLNQSSATLLVPTNGMITIVGGQNKNEILDSLDTFFNAIESIGLSVDSEPKATLVQNIVLKTDLGVELELATLSIGLGIEQTEYEPEQFSGVVYRLQDGSVALLFRSGKCLVTGSKTYRQPIDNAKKIECELEELGLELH